MERKRQIILLISMRAGDRPLFDIFKMSEEQCDEYLEKKYNSLTLKQKEVAGSDDLEDWHKVVGLTNEECKKFLQKRAEENAEAQRIIDDAISILSSP